MNVVVSEAFTSTRPSSHVTSLALPQTVHVAPAVQVASSRPSPALHDVSAPTQSSSSRPVPAKQEEPLRQSTSSFPLPYLHVESTEHRAVSSPSLSQQSDSTQTTFSLSPAPHEQLDSSHRPLESPFATQRAPSEQVKTPIPAQWVPSPEQRKTFGSPSLSLQVAPPEQTCSSRSGPPAQCASSRQTVFMTPSPPYVQTASSHVVVVMPGPPSHVLPAGHSLSPVSIRTVVSSRLSDSSASFVEKDVETRFVTSSGTSSPVTLTL
jgi:hypothetical protein